MRGGILQLFVVQGAPGDQGAFGCTGVISACGGVLSVVQGWDDQGAPGDWTWWHVARCRVTLCDCSPFEVTGVRRAGHPDHVLQPRRVRVLGDVLGDVQQGASTGSSLAPARPQHGHNMDNIWPQHGHHLVTTFDHNMVTAFVLPGSVCQCATT